jgi:hypothetical protein
MHTCGCVCAQSALIAGCVLQELLSRQRIGEKISTYLFAFVIASKIVIGRPIERCISSCGHCMRLFFAPSGIGSLFTCCVTQSCVHDVNRPVIDYFNSASGCFVFDLCLFVHDLRIASVCAVCVFDSIKSICIWNATDTFTCVNRTCECSVVIDFAFYFIFQLAQRLGVCSFWKSHLNLCSR